jgi:hypothetical protein
MKDKYKPTEAVTNNMQRGVALKNKYNTRSSTSYLTTVEQVSKAEVILKNSSEGFTLDDIKEIYNKLTKLEKQVDFRRRLEDKGPTEDIIKFYAFGGSSGLAWSRMILKNENILKSYTKVISSEEINKDGDDKVYGKMTVNKALNEELMQVTYVAMKPGVDLHYDEVTLEDIRLAKESFNKSLMRANMFHMVMTDSFSIIESYLAPTTMILNKSVVEQGEWLVTLQVHSEDVWEMIKNDEITGVSIGAVASVETLED